MIRHIAFIFIPILFTIVGELFLKHSVNQLDLSSPMGSIVLLATAPGVIVGITCIVCGGLLWLVGFSKFELSYMYPFLSLNYVAILLGSKIFLGEEIALSRYVAIACIMLGLFIISRSPHSSKESV